MFNPSQEVGQRQMVVMAPPVLGQASSACAQISAASNTARPYPLDAITSITPCLLLYPVGRAGKIKEVARARVHPAGSLFEGNPTPALYACVEVEELLKSIYDDAEIDIPTVDGKNCLGECVGSTILWHKRDILLVSQITMSDMEHISPGAQQEREESPAAPPSPAAPEQREPSPTVPPSPAAPEQ